MSKTIAVIRGDGIGPEITEATLRVLDALSLGLRTNSSKPASPRRKRSESFCRRRRSMRSRAIASR